MENGLSPSEVQAKRIEFGKNELILEKRQTGLKILISQFKNILNLILFLAAFFSLGIGYYVDGVFILAVIILNSFFGFIQEYRAEKSLEKLRNYSVPTVRVKRDGKEAVISSSELVPGDILIISEGDRISADCTAVDPQRLEVDEAILTGESLPVYKEENDALYSGTLVTKGKAMARVTAIGMQTRFGQIAKTLESVEVEQTPLQKNLADLGRNLSLGILAIALMIIPIGLFYQDDLFQITLTAVSIAVAAIPQGLPAVITISLALGTNRMAKRKAVVRTMSSVETLGSVQIVLVDKTGTLTENAMRVKQVWIPEAKDKKNVLLACTLGNTASLVAKEGSLEPDIVGDKTDGALLLWSSKEEENKDIPNGKIIDEHVFDAKTRMITTVWQQGEKTHVFVRGAPEAVLEKSNASEKLRIEVKKTYEHYASEGLRVIAIAAKNDDNAHQKNREELESELNFLGIIGIYDPPRKEVKTAVEDARRAGVRTIMVTGDNELTALAIAKEVGILEKGDDVVTGKQLSEMSDDDLKEILSKVNVFARSKPEDKLRLTTILKEQGYVVGVTGDGVNDALALKKADVGIAMGKTGTDVAKEASDIIIADDNFKTIVLAIEEGRTIYRNIATAITYLLTGNLSEIALVFFGTVLGFPAILLPTQILWINLVTDVFPAMALASDTKHPDVLSAKPRDPKESILNRKRLSFIVIGGFGLALFFLGLYIFLSKTFSTELATSIVFNLLIVSHMGIAFLVRGQSIFRANKALILSVLFILSLQVLINLSPFFRGIFSIQY